MTSKTMKEEGPLCGFPLLDFKLTLTDGGFHAVDSSQMAFETAARAALWKPRASSANSASPSTLPAARMIPSPPMVSKRNS